MLSRRHIRIKVLHALYSYFQNSNNTLAAGEKNLRKSISDIFRLYLYELKALVEIKRIAEEKIERKKRKRLPTREDLNPNLRFVENSFIEWLENHEKFGQLLEDHHVSFQDDREILRGIFNKLEEDEEYIEYMNRPEGGIEHDKRIIKVLYGRYITENELLHQFYEERSLHWADDLDAAQMMVVRTLKNFNEDSTSYSPLPKLLKDQDDLDFGLELFRKTINKSNSFEERIQEKAKNWETDRIALVDFILMKMALAELITFSEIPMKVTLNEYIELGKEYSTPRSSNFINGVLDKLREEMLENGEIRKIGRGLL